MRFSKLALCLAFLSPVLLTTAYGQRGGGGHSGGGGHASSGGGVHGGGFSGGGGTRGGSVGGGFRGGSGGSFRGGSVGGFRGGNLGGRGYYYGGRYYAGPSVYFGFGGYPYYYSPYAYGAYGYDPYYYGYGYDPYAYDGGGYSAPPPQQDYGYQQGYPPQGQAGPPPQQQQPQYGPPQTQPQSSNQGNQAQYYLIAFTDHTIKAASAYKVEGNQLYWQDLDNREQHAPLSSVDIPFSQQINRDRQVDFQIP